MRIFLGITVVLSEYIDHNYYYYILLLLSSYIDIFYEPHYLMSLAFIHSLQSFCSRSGDSEYDGSIDC